MASIFASKGGIVSHKDKILREILSRVTSLYQHDAIDSLRVEVMHKGTRQVIVSDGTMLTVPEMGRLVAANQKPTLKVV